MIVPLLSNTVEKLEATRKLWRTLLNMFKFVVPKMPILKDTIAKYKFSSELNIICKFNSHECSLDNGHLLSSNWLN